METLLVMVVLLTLMNLSPSVSDGPRLACYFNSRAKFRAGLNILAILFLKLFFCNVFLFALSQMHTTFNE